MTPAEALTGLGVIVSAVLVFFGSVRVARIQSRSSQETSGVTTGATLLTEAVGRWMEIAEAADAKATAAEQQVGTLREQLRELTQDVEAERSHSRNQDRHIDALRKVLHAWAQFGRELQTHWSTLRQHEFPPPLPEHEDLKLDDPDGT